MSADNVNLVLGALSLVLLGGALATAIGAATARSLFSMAMFVAATGALAAGVLATHGTPDAAVTMALIVGVLAPFVILACMLLSTRATKPRRGRPWLSVIAAAAAAIALLWITPDLGAAPARAESAADPMQAFWLAPLFFVAVAAALALLGYGERGALQRLTERDE